MAKSNQEMVEVPVDVLRQMQARLDALEHRERVELEARLNPNAKLLDPAYEAWKAEASRSAQERTQDIANKRYGSTGPRFRCRLDSSNTKVEQEKIDWIFPLEISAADALHAQSRYLEVMGVLKHDYRVVAEPVGNAA